MGRVIQVPLTTDTAEQDISGHEALINVYPKPSIGGKYPFNLVHTPGLAFFTQLPTNSVLGLYQNAGRAFAVTPTRMYEIFKNGTSIALGDVTLSGRVVMEGNGSQVVVVDGKRGFYYDTASNTVNELTSEGFYPAASVTYQDGYFIFDRTDTGQFFISDLLSVNFDPLNFATAEGQPDNLVYVLSDHREVFMFGTDTIEVWYNSGAPDFPFERNQGAFIEKGCGARYTIAKQDNTVYFVGSDLMVYKMRGYTPIRISTHSVEKTLKDIDLSQAFAYVYQSEGHLFYVLTVPVIDLTWCYDIATESWHIREGSAFKRHSSNNAILFDGKTLVGDFQNGKIYHLSDSYLKDDQQPIIRKFVLPTINSGRGYLSISSLELDMSSGIGLPNGEGSDPVAMLEFSKDGGNTWSNYKFSKIGKIGQFLQRVKWNRLGAARQFIFRVTISDPVPIDIGGAWIEVKR